MTRLYLMVAAVSALMLTFATSALAAAPVFDPATDLGTAIEAYANTLFDGIVDLYPVLLPIAAAFTLLAIAIGMFKKWLGRKKPAQATG